MRRIVVCLLAALLLVGCVSRPEPEPAVIRDGAPPWEAPRDAISYIRAAGLPELELGDVSDPWVVTLEVRVDGEDVEIPGFIGVDRLRAIQAPVHTHDAGGDVWLEGEGNHDMTLGNLFDLWGVRLADGCLGAACGSLEVLADGQPVADPSSLLLRGMKTVSVEATS